MNNFFLIDTHAHVLSEYYKDIEEVIKKAERKNVKYIINSGYDTKTNKEALNLSKMYKNMYVTIGIHPHEASSYKKEDLEFLKKNISDEKVIAIGEIGLDYYRGKNTKEKQIELFEKCLTLAKKHNKKVVIHTRDAFSDTFKLLKKYKVKGIIHSFSGTEEEAKSYVEEGFLLGINGIVSFKNSSLKFFLNKIDLKNIVIETDSPYLSPHPFRGRANEPANVLLVAESLAKIYNIETEDVIRITTTNFLNYFDFDNKNSK